MTDAAANLKAVQTSKDNGAETTLAGVATNPPCWSNETQAELDRFGFSDPYDPRFIHTAVFGTKMAGRAQRWPNIDFSALAQVNPDIVGWVHMESTPIDYPVVAAHFDGGYYLCHNYSSEESLHGQISLAFGCRRNMGGRNTVLLGHAMHDWSMFRAVRALCNQEFFDAHPSIDLMAKDGISWRGSWFAAAQYHSDDPWPTRTCFADNADFASWLERIVAQNWLKTNVQPGANAHILTCCTCALTPGPYDMRAVFAVIYPKETMINSFRPPCTL